MVNKTMNKQKHNLQIIAIKLNYCKMKCNYFLDIHLGDILHPKKMVYNFIEVTLNFLEIHTNRHFRNKLGVARMQKWLHTYM